MSAADVSSICLSLLAVVVALVGISISIATGAGTVARAIIAASEKKGKA